MTLAGIFFDEVALMPESFVEQGIARLSIEGAKFFAHIIKLGAIEIVFPLLTAPSAIMPSLSFIGEFSFHQVITFNCLKPSEEITEETEEIKDYISIIDRQGLKMLASALKDFNETPYRYSSIF